VKATELLDFLREFHRDKLGLLRRHQASARFVSDYDFNNTYQYVIAREEMHVTWVRDAILDVSGQINAPVAGEAEDPAEPPGPAGPVPEQLPVQGWAWPPVRHQREESPA